MARVINLKKKDEEKKEEEIVVQHPAFKNDQVITDTGETVEFNQFRWKAPSVYRASGTFAPYVFAFFVFVVAVLIAIISRDIITSVLFFLMSVMVVVQARKAVPMIDIEVSPLGIKRGQKSYKYDEMTSFWMHYEPEKDIRELSLQMKKWSSPYVIIQLANQDPVQIRSFLIEFVSEEKHEITALHSFVRWLGL